MANLQDKWVALEFTPNPRQALSVIERVVKGIGKLHEERPEPAGLEERPKSRVHGGDDVALERGFPFGRVSETSMELRREPEIRSVAHSPCPAIGHGLRHWPIERGVDLDGIEVTSHEAHGIERPRARRRVHDSLPVDVGPACVPIRIIRATHHAR